MYSTVEQLNVTIDCLSGRIWELQQIIKVLRNKNKAFEEMEEKVSQFSSEKKDLVEEKNKFESSFYKVEAENKKIKKKIKNGLKKF